MKKFSKTRRKKDLCAGRDGKFYKAANIKKILWYPELCDFNKSSVIEPIEAIYLGTALSIDSIGVGITSSIFNFNEFIFSMLVCLFQIFLLSAGMFFGEKINKIKYVDKISGFFSGMILVAAAAVKFFC